ncbi:hypothetical protein ACP040_004577 [Salmonella enterica]
MSLWMGILTFSLLCLCLFLQLRQVNRFLREHNAPALPTRLSDSVSLLFLLLGMFLVYQGNMHALLMFTALLPLLWLAAASFYQRILVCRSPGPAAARRAVSVAAAGIVQQHSDVLSDVGRVVEREKTLRT